MMGKRILAFLVIGIILFMQRTLLLAEEADHLKSIPQDQRVTEWRKERDEFFKNHERSPLPPREKKNFRGLKYFPFDPKYVFYAGIERYIFHINNPRYYATFLTNKGTNKRYIRYGKVRFRLDSKDFSIEVYKSILSDSLFIPFKDETNGKETYGGGRYIDAEILPGYKMVLDFNMAYYPSCAYNEKFICVLPPKENVLAIPIRAGERNLSLIKSTDNFSKARS
jgi:uncharacterized protein (DUF1684 family)